MRRSTVTVLPPQGCDDDVAGIMAELSSLQTWTVMLCANERPVPGAREAMDLIQRTRCLIVKHCYRDSDASLAEDPKGLSGEAVAARAEGIAQ